MSLKVIDGARTLDGANAGIDIPPANYANGNTMNSTGVDMSDFFELIGFVQAGVVIGTAQVDVYVQESNDNSTYTNIVGAKVTVANTQSNTGQAFSVNWKHPDRKKYARVSGVVSVANGAIYGVSTLRVQAHGGDMTIDSSVDETK